MGTDSEEGKKVGKQRATPKTTPYFYSFSKEGYRIDAFILKNVWLYCEGILNEG